MSRALRMRNLTIGAFLTLVAMLLALMSFVWVPSPVETMDIANKLERQI